MEVIRDQREAEAGVLCRDSLLDEPPRGVLLARERPTEMHAVPPPIDVAARVPVQPAPETRFRSPERGIPTAMPPATSAGTVETEAVSADIALVTVHGDADLRIAPRL